MKPDKQLVKILQKTDEAFNEESGKRDEWSKWFAERLIDSTDFNRLTQRQWKSTELAEALKALEVTYERQKPKHHWSHFFALRLSN